MAATAQRGGPSGAYAALPFRISMPPSCHGSPGFQPRSGCRLPCGRQTDSKRDVPLIQPLVTPAQENLVELPPMCDAARSSLAGRTTV